VLLSKGWVPLFEIKRLWGPFFPGYSGVLPRFLRIFPELSGILPGVSTNQNFWWCACTTCTPASHTTDREGCTIIVSQRNGLKTIITSFSFSLNLVIYQNTQQQQFIGSSLPKNVACISRKNVAGRKL